VIFYYLIFVLGLLAGYVLRHSLAARIACLVMVVSGNMLIALFGMQMTNAPEVRQSLPGDLLAAVLIALSAVIGSVLVSFGFIWAVRNWLPCPATADEPSGAAPGRMNLRAWRATSISLGLLALGMAGGTQMRMPHSDAWINGLLWVMIAAVGMMSGHELCAIGRRREGRQMSRASLLLFFGLPATVIVGTLAFSACAGLFLQYRWSDCMLCAAPLGWQTLGGPLVQKLRNARLGNIAFLVNMLRDVVSLLTIPMVGRGNYSLLKITPGGVSTMDILLPGIMAASPPRNLVYAMWVGASCSFWAPILIYLIARVFA
jgi:uncharacterized membrane protein YbjE (DUF340 family)